MDKPLPYFQCLRNIIFASFFLTVAFAANAANEIVVYSARNEQLIKPLFDAYTKETGTTIKFLTDKEGALLQKLKAEGANTPADMLITADAGNLWQATNLGLLQPVRSQKLLDNIPSHLRDPANQWFGLSVRARTIIYNRTKIKPSALSTYEDLGNPKWKGRLCLRTSKSVYNQSLVATMIHEYGEAKTEQIIKSWVNNLATSPISDDSRAMLAVVAGQCDLTIANTYYFGGLLKKNPKLPLAIFWPNQNIKDSGVHVNVSGAGITRHAKHQAEAVKFMEWLSSDKAQNLFADINMEYPVNPKIKPDAKIAAWGQFKQNPTNLVKAGELQATAVKLMDRTGYK